MSASGPPPASREELLAALEGLIFVSGEPITPAEMRQALGIDEMTLRGALAELMRAHEGPERGLRLEEVAGGVRLATRPEVAPFLRRLARLRHRRRLSQAGLETLAVIAYRQPITGPEIEAIRGVSPDAALETLLEKRLIRILGRKQVVGRPILYGTSKEFLVHFGINELEDLPPIEEFEAAFAREEGLDAGDAGPDIPAVAEEGSVVSGGSDEEE